MSSNSYRIGITTQRRIDREVQERVAPVCRHRKVNGWYWRGNMSRYTCPCGQERWDDGTRCPACLRYNPAYISAEKLYGKQPVMRE